MNHFSAYQKAMHTIKEKLRDFKGAYHIVDTKGRVVHVSHRWSQIMGYTQQEVVGMSSSRFISKDALKRAQKSIQSVFETGYIREIPGEFVTSTGKSFQCLISATVLRDDREHPIGALGVIVPISQQEYERHLVTHSRQHTLNASSGFDAEIIVNPQGIIEFINAPGEALTGWTLRDAVGRRLKRIYMTIYDQTQTMCEPPALTAMRMLEPTIMASHITLTNRAGQPQSVEHRAWPLFDSEGELLGAKQIFCTTKTSQSQNDREFEDILNTI